MAAQLFRHIVILRGNNSTVIKQLNHVITMTSGDWITITDNPNLIQCAPHHYSPAHSKQLLGREFKHAIFDATNGFNLDALAILTGTLSAGSVLILILPPTLRHWHDHDSLRWNESTHAISVPHFVAHLQSVLAKQSQNYPHHTHYVTVDDSQTHHYLINMIEQYIQHDINNNVLDCLTEQHHLLANIIKLDTKIILITAKRGRGKSALAGMFAKQHQCVITAPNKNAITTLMHFAPENTPFYAPDELLNILQTESITANWLIIDEAAMIPLPIITKLISHFKHILLTSTVDGYEGTGQGLLLKLLTDYQQHNQISAFNLQTPIRWLANDPLEYFIDNLIVADWKQPHFDNNMPPLMIKSLRQDELGLSPSRLMAFFGLLKAAHYRTTLVDLRRLLDANNIALYCAQYSEDNIVGSLVTIKEGGLDDALIDQVLKGYRRPKGNLVAQSLVAHSGEIMAAQLTSIRINRIAVHQFMRKQRVASQLLTKLLIDSQRMRCDFISVSFSYSIEMYQFWSKCGFHIVQIGTHKEASSDSYAAMAIYPLSQNGRILCNKMQLKLARNWYWLKSMIQIDLPIIIDEQQSLNDDDKLILSLFATTLYSYTASYSVLFRLIHSLSTSHSYQSVHLPLLTSLVKHQFDEKQVVKQYGLASKSQLLILLREEVFQFITINGLINE